MSSLRGLKWRHITTTKEFCCQDSLFVGQVFTWRKLPVHRIRLCEEMETIADKEPTASPSMHCYVGAIGQNVIELREHGEQVLYRALVPQLQQQQEQKQEEETYQKGVMQSKTLDTLHTRVIDFLNVNVDFGVGIQNLEALHKHFSHADPQFFGRISSHLPGVRVLRQDVFECLISFICSSNNNVSRITVMLQRLCEKYGTLLGQIELAEDSKEGVNVTKDTATTTETVSCYSFPTLEQLSRATERELRDLGFGYRAKYIVHTVEQLRTMDSNFLEGLRSKEHTTDDVLEKLVQFKGIGYKVASCIALFSCDKHELVPIDVHMARLARQHYASQLRKAGIPTTGKSKETMNPKKMKQYMELYVQIFGLFAGWAQMVLFGSQLGSLKTRIPPDIQRSLRERKGLLEQTDENLEQEEEGLKEDDSPQQGKLRSSRKRRRLEK